MLKNKRIGNIIKFLLFLLILTIALVNGFDKDLNQKEDIGDGSQQEQNGPDGNANVNVEDSGNEESSVMEDGIYTSKEEVAEYIHLYEKLPSNFITKKEAQKLGWENSKGNLAQVAPGKSIGGDYFGNYEGNLPEKDGRDYYECDINYESGYRGSERIVYSDDGLIYYTADHYETFELLYGEE